MKKYLDSAGLTKVLKGIDVRYATKSELMARWDVVKVQPVNEVYTLPTPTADLMYKIYLMPAGATNTPVSGNFGDIFDEWIVVRSGEANAYTYAWEKIGNTRINMADYALKNGSNSENFNTAALTAKGNIYVKDASDNVKAAIYQTGSIEGTGLTVKNGTISVRDSTDATKASITAAGAITGTSLSTGSGSISGGAITGTSLSTGTGAISGGAISGQGEFKVLNAQGTSVASISQAGAIGGTSLTVSGGIIGASVTATGAISGATLGVESAKITGTDGLKVGSNSGTDGAFVAKATITQAGAITGTSLSTGSGSISGGAISGSTVTATGAISGASASISGAITGSTLTLTGTNGLQVKSGDTVKAYINNSGTASFTEVYTKKISDETGGTNNKTALNVYGAMPGVLSTGKTPNNAFIVEDNNAENPGLIGDLSSDSDILAAFSAAGITLTSADIN